MDCTRISSLETRTILKISPDRQEPSSEEMHLLGRELIASHFAENLGLVQRVAATDRTDLTHDWKIVRCESTIVIFD
jgi:hypothetical protein